MLLKVVSTSATCLFLRVEICAPGCSGFAPTAIAVTPMAERARRTRRLDNIVVVVQGLLLYVVDDC